MVTDRITAAIEEAKSMVKDRITAAADTDPLEKKLQQIFAKVASMSDSAWKKVLQGIAKGAGWIYGKDGDRLAEMRKETFLRKTRAYLAKLDPAEKIAFAGGLLIILASGGLMAPFIATAHGRGFVNHLAAPDEGHIYLMQAVMPDGGTGIKGGQTTRTPEIRAAELSAQHNAEYEVIASRQVADVDQAEGELLGMLQEHLGAPDVGQEQWNLDVDFDPVPLLAGVDGGPVEMGGEDL